MSSDTTPLESIDYETVLGRLYAHYKYAGASSEDEYDFDGGFSYHAESHAFAMGFGVGFTAAATGDFRAAGLIVAVAMGMNRGEKLSDPKIAADIRAEPQYALFGIVLGALLGNPQRLFENVSSLV